jgi:hypothetical protein
MGLYGFTSQNKIHISDEAVHPFSNNLEERRADGRYLLSITRSFYEFPK